ncbi:MULTISPECIES: M20 family metallopeptidase [unclassified Leucobacter]|uniref:M20 family metallopeptidase n=1 Tax=unclassified Leucobacter TaxID=2621730 RepID=UPI003015CC88
MEASDLLRRVEATRAAYIEDLAALVGIDSGSDDPAGVNRVADWVQRRLGALGFSVERCSDPQGRAGDTLVGRRSGSGSRRVLLFAHMDTVFARGDAAARPFSIDADGKAHGPGVTDDKAGVIAGLHAAAQLIADGTEDYGELVLAFTPDEETGSAVGGPFLEALAEDADVAFCLECARENGDLVVSRKGAIDLNIEVHGRAAHSGIEPERGAHAGLEAAHLTVFLQELANTSTGLTVNVGILRAGDRTNIVPDRASLRVEMRAAQAAALADVVARIEARAAQPVVAGTRIELIVADDCPPLEETPAIARLGALAIDISQQLGFTPGLARTGGVSDGNRVAARGVPTLDGLGPVGGGDHTPEEWLDLSTVPERIALLAALIRRSSDPAFPLDNA